MLPEVFTESADADGKLIEAVDVEKLKEDILDDIEKEVTERHPEFAPEELNIDDRQFQLRRASEILNDLAQISPAARLKLLANVANFKPTFECWGIPSQVFERLISNCSLCAWTSCQTTSGIFGEPKTSNRSRHPNSSK